MAQLREVTDRTVARTKQEKQRMAATRTMAQGGARRRARVSGVTTVLMGPFATRILADQRADVITVESLQGDGARRPRA